MEKEGKMEAKETQHSPVRMVLIITHFLIFCVTLAINYLSSQPNVAPGLYESNTGAISDAYNTQVTPAGWTFTIWAFIYIWQLVHIIYSHTLLCRRNATGYHYVSPGHIHPSFYAVYIINCLLNLGWIFLFDRQYMEVAFVFLLAIACTIYACGTIVCWSLNKAGAAMEQLAMVKDIWMTRILVLNGLAFYGTWCTIATLLNFSIVLQYRANLDGVTVAWISLGLLTAEIIVWFVLENFVFDRHLRYCFSQYIVLPIALGGILSKNYTPDTPHMSYVLFLLALSGALGLTKVIVIAVRSWRCPITYTKPTIEPTISNTDIETSQ